MRYCLRIVCAVAIASLIGCANPTTKFEVLTAKIEDFAQQQHSDIEWSDSTYELQEDSATLVMEGVDVEQAAKPRPPSVGSLLTIPYDSGVREIELAFALQDGKWICTDATGNGRGSADGNAEALQLAQTFRDYANER